MLFVFQFLWDMVRWFAFGSKLSSPRAVGRLRLAIMRGKLFTIWLPVGGKAWKRSGWVHEAYGRLQDSLALTLRLCNTARMCTLCHCRLLHYIYAHYLMVNMFLENVNWRIDNLLWGVCLATVDKNDRFKRKLLIVWDYGKRKKRCSHELSLKVIVFIKTLQNFLLL